MKTLCFVIYDYSVGGVNRVLERLTKRLVEKYRVHIISLHGTEIPSALQFDNNVEILSLNMKEDRLRNQMFHAVPKLLHFLRVNHVDVCFLEATQVGFIGAPITLFTKTKIVFCDHGALVNQLDDDDVTRMRKIAVGLCDKTIVLTQKNKEDYINMCHVKATQVENIYNWINKEQIDAQRVYDKEKKRILTAGRFTKEKGFDLLIKVAQIVMPRNPDWEWHIFGDGILKEQISRDIEVNGLQKQVILHGFSSNMEKVYQDSAIYVLPSYREGIPLVLLEAKAFKLPCVSFDIITGPNEIIMDGINGTLIEPYNIEKMAEALELLMNDPVLRTQYSENAYLNIDKFSEETVLNQWISLISELTGAE